MIALSTHDLTRRSTFCHIIYGWFFSTFNSRPHKEVDEDDRVKNLEEQVFQLTTSQGGRPDRQDLCIQLSLFQLTTSQGGRQSQRVYRETVEQLSTHDLTRRSTVVPYRNVPVPASFNSRPHKEVDRERALALPGLRFFQLTTSQGGRPYPVQLQAFSHHIFQLTTSQGGRRCISRVS